ncbi:MULTISPECIES: DUF6221 family protein [Nocardia]|uniref:DUF6221 family protein n=1 Tax=Nocardia TaxID=1817 RepID=UPI0024559963|nr:MULTISPECIES: DUF6221 family protein [Nocardia]
MSSILDFIAARVAEDEARARAAIESVQDDTDGDPGEWVASRTYSGAFSACVDIVDADSSVVSDEGYPSYEQAVHIAAEDPNTTLRRCTMVRAMLRHAEKVREDELEQASVLGYIGRVVQPYTFQLMHRDLAAYWNTHPEYRKEWATDAE